MDSEEHHEIQKLRAEGQHPGNEGPFYHHSFWEAYKGSVKGKLGGVFIGAIIGAIAGVIAAGIMVASSLIPLASAAPLLVVGGIAAAGMLYGAHEFSETGRVTGAVAAAQKVAESRMQEFEKEKFAELKKDIGDIKKAVGLKNDETNISLVESKQSKHRITHFDENVPRPKGNKYIFWKIALIGLLAGAGIGALLGFTSGGAAVLGALHLGAEAGAAAVIPEAAVGWACTVAMGAVGASFGINRDVFRKIFDRTDMWFRGIFNLNEGRALVKAQQQEMAQENPNPRSKTFQPSPVSTLIYPETNVEDAPASDTFFRDKVLASAKQTLLDMDHTNARAH